MIVLYYARAAAASHFHFIKLKGSLTPYPRRTRLMSSWKLDDSYADFYVKDRFKIFCWMTQIKDFLSYRRKDINSELPPASSLSQLSIRNQVK